VGVVIMRFADFIERMTLEEKLKFIMRKDSFQTNSLEKFDIPSINILKINELGDHVLPENVPTSSFDYKYVQNMENIFIISLDQKLY
jgi:hypothetical protein